MSFLDAVCLKNYREDYFGRMKVERDTSARSVVVRVRVGYDDNVCITQSFRCNPAVHAEWEWNRCGRVSRVSFQVANNKHLESRFLWNCTFQEANPAWTTLTFEMHHQTQLSVYACVIDSALAEQDVAAQFARLLRYGHRTARQLETAFISGNVYDVACLPRATTSLTLAADNVSLRQTLQEANALHVAVSGSDNVMKVSYSPFLSPAQLNERNLKHV